MIESSKTTSTETGARVIPVAFLYLDLGQCTRCVGTDAVLDTALAAAAPALEALGYRTELTKIHVQSAEEARAHDFIASPTIRIDGHDLQPEAHQNRCVECGDLCNCADGVDCRVWEWEGAQHLTPPVAMIVGRLLDVARSGGPTGSQAGTASRDAATDAAGAENIARFFANGTPDTTPAPTQTAAPQTAAPKRCCESDCC